MSSAAVSASLSALALTCCIAASADAETIQLGNTAGFAYASNTKVVGAGDGWSAKASCPGKRLAVGGGAIVTGSPATGYMSSSYPSAPAHRSWTSRGFNAASSGAVFAATHVICAKPQLGIHYASKAGTVGVGPAGGGAKVHCTSGRPGSGGVRMLGPVQGASLRTTSPFDGPDANNFDDGWRAAVGSISGAKRKFRVFAICSNEFGTTFPSVTLDAAPSVSVTETTCILGPVEVSGPTGGGVFIPGPALGAHIHSFGPVDGADTDMTPDDGWRFSLSNDAGPEKLVNQIVYCRSA